MENFAPFDGTWTYRSFHNNPDISVPFNDLRFGAGTLILTHTTSTRVGGSLGGEGWSLNLQGSAAFGNPYSIRFQGIGTIGGEEWIYDYQGYLSPIWPNGIDQRSAIVGTIVRTVPHSNGQSPAGYVASWIAVIND